MPRYFFDIEGPDHLAETGDDPYGTMLTTDMAAFDYARRIVRELKEDGGYRNPRLIIVVKTESGRTLFAIPFN